MRKLAIIVLVLAIVTVPAYAGKGNPETAQQGEQPGKAQQSGPGGPKYGNPTAPIPTPTPKSPEGKEGMTYRVYLPFVSNNVSSVFEPVSVAKFAWR